MDRGGHPRLGRRQEDDDDDEICLFIIPRCCHTSRHISRVDEGQCGTEDCGS
jgi:hypothetical protein